MNLDTGQIITQILAFLVMLWVLKKFGWKPLLDLLDERRQKIQADFDAIAAQRDEAKKLEETYRQKLKEIDAEGRHKIQEALTEGRKIAAQIQNEAQANAKAMLAKAKGEIEREIAQAKKQLKNDTVNIAIATAEKILNETLDSTKRKKLIADLIEKADLK